MDAYSKCILGWYVAPTLEAAYSIKALEMAIKTLPKAFDDTLIHHSDKFVSFSFAKVRRILVITELSVL